MKVSADDIDADIRMIFPQQMQGMRKEVLGTLGLDDTQNDGKMCIRDR